MSTWPSITRENAGKRRPQQARSGGQSAAAGRGQGRPVHLFDAPLLSAILEPLGRLAHLRVSVGRAHWGCGVLAGVTRNGAELADLRRHALVCNLDIRIEGDAPCFPRLLCGVRVGPAAVAASRDAELLEGGPEELHLPVHLPLLRAGGLLDEGRDPDPHGQQELPLHARALRRDAVGRLQAPLLRHRGELEGPEHLAPPLAGDLGPELEDEEVAAGLDAGHPPEVRPLEAAQRHVRGGARWQEPQSRQPDAGGHGLAAGHTHHHGTAPRRRRGREAPGVLGRAATPAQQ
eukprot:CAMPEP_0179370728 /NCGR_PEP_ID=MMETSP0797-20121207/85344_1 /TAXON_ID=47934 /ORGANISM="Dinophysis acuminata, Strain DAEP01" /LENGTH=289 /DNA_ID=CAMNT_0021086527 /DNA_START=392 /DNA_END=1261 /DNA_ORIENTATION=+